MKILIPDYLLESLLRHYKALADAYRYDGNIKAANASRMAGKEIQKIESIILKQKQNG